MTKPGSQLVDKLRRNPGDATLWGEFYRHFHATVFYTSFKLSRGQSSSAEDLTQEAFLRFFENADLGDIPDDEHAAAYLRQVARNLFRDRMRSAESKNISLTDMPEGLTETVDEDERNQLLIDIERLALSLSEADRRLLQYLMSGLSADEIADKERVTHGAVGVRIHRLRRKLAETMA